MKFILFIMVVISGNAYSAATDICDFLKTANCRGVTRQLRRSSFPTSPSSSTAANLNPANVSYDRGVGLDVVYQSNNPVLLGLSSGTGKMGGALISGSMENTFFGNRAPELSEGLADRLDNKTQFRNKKLTFALAGKLFSQKDYSLDAGFILKRHPMIKTINSGVGLSGRLWKFSFGASTYKDDYYIDLTKYGPVGSAVPYSVLLGKDSIQDDFRVTTLALGLRMWNFAFDYGSIRSKSDYYEDETVITIYSGSFHYNNVLINVASRNEVSNAYDNLEDDSDFTKPSNIYSGIQYSINDHIVLGVQYNYFLLNEFSISTTIFI